MNHLITKHGKKFFEAPVKEVLHHLSGLNRKTISTNPSKLQLSNKVSNIPDELFLIVKNGTTARYPIRESFLKKLMRWYKLSEHITDKLNPGTIVAVGNDFLSNIKSSSVNIKIEDGDALTILSPKYSEFTDKDLLEICSERLDIKTVSRDDFAMRVYSEDKVKLQPVPGDECGFGFNVFNSETGFMAIQVAHYIMRYVCSNGAIVRTRLNDTPVYHYNQTRTKIIEYISKGIKSIEENREVVIKKLSGLKDKPALETLKTIKMQLGSIIGLTEASALIMDFTNYAQENDNHNEYQNDLYSLFNFITHNAKNRSIMQRIQMEEFAGKLILN